MRTTNGRRRWQPAVGLALVLWLLVGSLSAVSGATAAPPKKFFIGLAAGIMYPQQGVFREIYGPTVWPVELQLELDAGRKISLFSAARYSEASGNTVSLSPGESLAAYALNWRAAALRLGVNYRLSAARFSPFIGAGGSFTFYREKWLDLPLENKGQKAGFFVQAGGRYRWQRRWHARVQLEYSSVPAGSGPAGRVNLGGLSLFFGLAAGVF